MYNCSLLFATDKPPKITDTNPLKTLFVGRLDPDTTEGSARLKPWSRMSITFD